MKYRQLISTSILVSSSWALLAFSTKPHDSKKINEVLSASPKMSDIVTSNSDGLDTDPKRAQIVLFAKEESLSSPHPNPATAIMKVCEKNEAYAEICSIFKETTPAKSTSSARSSSKRVSLAENNLEDLNKLDLQSLTSIVGRQSLKNVMSFSKKMAEKEACQSSSLYTALGSQLEAGFPEADYKNLSMKMYEKATSCAQDESSFRAAFRLGMIRILDNQCPQAITALESIPKLEGLGFIHSRAQYWASFCRKSSTASPAVVKEQVFERFNQYPMSFHSVLFSLERDDAVFKKVQAQIEPKVQFRTVQGPDSLNTRIAFVEAFLRENKVDFARTLMAKVNPTEVSALEPHFRLYLGFLYHRTFLSLQKFQVLSQLFNEDVSFKSLSSLKIMYPLWKYEIVDSHTKSLDPLLVLSLIRQESAFQEEARSRVGARGLMQIMPRTANSMVKKKLKAEELYNPELNVKLGTTYIDMLLKKYDGNVFHVLAAYNAGGLRVDEWKKRYPTDNSLLFMDLIPFRETREYVSSILRNYYWYSHLYPDQSKRQFVFWEGASISAPVVPPDKSN